MGSQPLELILGTHPRTDTTKVLKSLYGLGALTTHRVDSYRPLALHQGNKQEKCTVGDVWWSRVIQAGLFVLKVGTHCRTSLINVCG